MFSIDIHNEDTLTTIRNALECVFFIRSLYVVITKDRVMCVWQADECSCIEQYNRLRNKLKPYKDNPLLHFLKEEFEYINCPAIDEKDYY